MSALQEWDREGGFVIPSSEFPMADLYLCWNRKSLFVGLYAHDVCEDAFYRDRIIRVSDRAEWIVRIGDSEIRARIGAGLEPTLNDTRVRVTNSSGINGNFRNIACLEIPSTLVGKSRLKGMDEIDLSSTFFTQGRGYSTEWSGRFTLVR